ncbi:hypothetical protein N7450_011782 [Penicillium hetheringtonii]|uniref:Uncharacterized protein n=1 Tax=Penicillium hetheringtonii TaxID=911720 RepID=A0AAD6DAV5_9EURO|nr:hypothetical protein N7450_011782 [Penicillium hetheringtonii]
MTSGIGDTTRLRMNVQEQERIQRRIDGLRSYWEPAYQEDEEWMNGEDVEDIEIDDNDSSPLLHDSHHHAGQMESTIQKLYDVKAQRSQLSRKLYEAEAMLPPAVKKAYDSIRKNPKWYMRNELIADFMVEMDVVVEDVVVMLCGLHIPIRKA